MNITGHPPWLIRKAYSQESIHRIEQMLDRACLSTVCQSAHCPNLGECFYRGTATFMILGTRCTRRCRFCAVEKAVPALLDPMEPARVARAAKILGLSYVVVTSVTRDDLPDGGAGQFVETIRQIRTQCPDTAVEVLVPDFNGSLAALQRVLNAAPDMFNHNVETIPRLYATVRPRARYARSLAVLEQAARSGLRVKSGLMLGLGETAAEVKIVLRDLKKVGCRYITLGQYLAPSEAHLPVQRYVPPAEFEAWGNHAEALGFESVMSGPLIRSSYLADTMNAPDAHRVGAN